MTRAPSPTSKAIAIYIDIALLIVLLLLFSPRATGLAVHEWLGLAFAIPLLVHLILSWTWIRAATTRIVTATRRARINYALNWILFILIILEVTSGIVISEVTLPSMGMPTVNDRAWRGLHNWALNATLALIGIHVAMNWRLLAGGLRRYVWRGSSDEH